MADSSPFDRFGTAMEKLGKAAEKAQANLTSMFSALERSLNSLGTQFTRLVQLTNPAAVIRFTLALRDTGAVIGQILTPILEKFTVMVRKIGDAIINLDAKTKQLLGGLALGSGLAGAFAGLSVALGVLFRVMAASPLVRLATLVAGLVGLSQTVDELAPLGDALKNLFSAIVEAARPLVQALAAVLTPILEGLVGVITVLARVLAGVFEAITPLVEVVRELLYILSSLLEGFVKLASELGGELATLIKDVLVDALTVFTEAVRDFVAFLRRTVNELRAMIGLDPLDDSAAEKSPKKSSVGAAVRNASIGGLQEAINAAYRNAFQSALVQDIAKRQLGLIERIKGQLDEIIKKSNEDNNVRRDQSRRFD